MKIFNQKHKLLVTAEIIFNSQIFLGYFPLITRFATTGIKSLFMHRNNCNNSWRKTDNKFYKCVPIAQLTYGHNATYVNIHGS